MYMIKSVFDRGAEIPFPLWVARRIQAHTMTFDEGITVGDDVVWSKSIMIVRNSFLEALADQFEHDDSSFNRAEFLDVATQGTGDREVTR